MGLREYETIFILKADLGEDAVERVTGKVERALTEYNSVLLVKENWGKKKMAYDIAKQSKGTYMFYHFLGGGKVVAEIERNLKIDDAVLRYMTVKVDEDVDAEARLKAIAERPKAPASTLDDDDDMGGGRRDFGRGRDRGDRGDRGFDRGDRGFDRGDRGPGDRGGFDRGDRGPGDRGPSDRGVGDRDRDDEDGDLE